MSLKTGYCKLTLAQLFEWQKFNSLNLTVVSPFAVLQSTFCYISAKNKLSTEVR